MKKVRYSISIGFPNANQEGEFEVSDYATEEDIYEAMNIELDNCLEIDWEIVE